MEGCIAACGLCHKVCTETIMYCLEQGEDHAAPEHIRLMLDCAQACHVAQDFMARRSPMHARMCALCEEICERCAQDCQSFGSDPMMVACAKACRSCAQACRDMTQA
jgi:hypothetical protein